MLKTNPPVETISETSHVIFFARPKNIYNNIIFIINKLISHNNILLNKCNIIVFFNYCNFSKSFMPFVDFNVFCNVRIISIFFKCDSFNNLFHRNKT